MADDKLTRLADPETAIASYLDELLHTATDTALREEIEAPEPVKPAPPEPRVATRTKPASVPTVEKPPARPEPPKRVRETPAEPERPVVRQVPEAPVPVAPSFHVYMSCLIGLATCMPNFKRRGRAVRSGS